MHLLDFTHCGFGLLVKHSAHYHEEHCTPADARERYGIVVEKEFVQEGRRVVCYPRVHWEGAVTDSLCHPVNLVPVRPHLLPVIEIDAGADLGAIPAPH